ERFLDGGGSGRVIAGEDWGYRYRWARVTRTAAIEHRPKDLRDTFASHLLSAGVALAYVSRQLGHADVAVTAQPYAQGNGGGDGDLYIEPPRLLPGEVPADLLARLTVADPAPLSAPRVDTSANLLPV